MTVDCATPIRALRTDLVVSQLLLPTVLFLQDFLILIAVQAASQQQTHQQRGDDCQIRLIGDRDWRLAPGLAGGKIVFPLIMRFFLFPSPAIEEGDHPRLQAEIIGQQFDPFACRGAIADSAPKRLGTGERDGEILLDAVVDGIRLDRTTLGGIDDEIGFHARDQGRAEGALLGIPESGGDKAAIGNPERSPFARKGVRTFLVGAQARQFVLATRVGDDIVDDPDAQILERQQQVPLGIVLATIARDAPPEMGALGLIDPIDGAHGSITEAGDLGQAIGQCLCGLQTQGADHLPQLRLAFARGEGVGPGGSG